jgi:hypothetical protein
MQIILILENKFPDTEWFLSGEDYEGLNWLDDSPKPSKQELEELWPEVQVELAHQKVQKLRAEAYSKISDALFFKYQRNEATQQQWLDAVKSVKDEYPYPNG